jgi:hypothetical protein
MKGITVGFKKGKSHGDAEFIPTIYDLAIDPPPPLPRFSFFLLHVFFFFAINNHPSPQF